jgi:hydrogenase small subunit
MLNRIAPGQPGSTIDDVLINAINLMYHSVVMSSAGEPAAVLAMKAKREGEYVLVIEGGIPTRFEGGACSLWSYQGQEVTMQVAVAELAQHTSVILAVGTCAAFGGIPKAPPNPTDVQSVSEFLANQSITGKTLINISGCPAHPDWTIGTIVKLLLAEPIELDAHLRPLAFYGMNVHEHCPRNESAPTHEGFATTFGQDLLCLEDLGCRGPDTFGGCPNHRWNNGVNWCVDCNGMCIGCTEPDFPGGAIYGPPPPHRRRR